MLSLQNTLMSSIFYFSVVKVSTKMDGITKIKVVSLVKIKSEPPKLNDIKINVQNENQNMNLETSHTDENNTTDVNFPLVEVKTEPLERNDIETTQSEIQLEENINLKISQVQGSKTNHKCELCSKTFSRSYNLRIHIRSVHEGKRNFKCEKCEKAFSEAGNLNRHITQVHEGNRNHKCGQCGKAFD